MKKTSPTTHQPQNMSTKDEAGFSLVEVMVVVGIIGILAAIAIPRYQNYVSTSKRQVASSTLQQLYVALETFRAEQTNGYLCPSSECDGAGTDTYTYTYTENSSGTPTSATLINGIANPYLTDFQPRAPGTSGAILYDYSVTVTDGAGTAVLTATPVSGRGAPAGTISINFP